MSAWSHDVTCQVETTVFPSGYTSFEILDRTTQRGLVELIDPDERRTISAIGIEKGESFAPDGALKARLEEAAKVGDAMGWTMSFSFNLNPRGEGR
jgi:hypothetical protein